MGIGRTMTTQVEVDNIADTNIDDTKEALVPLLELPLVKDLDCNHRGVLDLTSGRRGRL